MYNSGRNGLNRALLPRFQSKLFTSSWEMRFLCRSAVLGRGHWDVSAPELDPMTHGSSIISIFELGPRFEIQPFYSKFAGNLLS